MSRLAKKRMCVRSKIPDSLRGHVLSSRLAEDEYVGHVGQ